MPPKLLSLAMALLVCALPVRATAQDAAALAKAAGEALTANQFPKALELFLAIPDSAAPEHRLAKHTGAVLTLGNMGRSGEVWPHVEAARQLAKEIGTDAAMVQFLNAEGWSLSHSRTGDRGIASFERAVAIAENNGDQAKPSLLNVYRGLSNAYQQVEDYDRQSYYNEKAFSLDEDPTPIEQFNYHIIRGIAYFEMYERDRAEAAFLKALELSAETKRTRDRAFVMGEMGFLYWTFDKDAGRALPAYDEGIALAVESKAAPMEANWRTNRGNVYRDLGQYERAEADYRDALAILERGGQTHTGFHIRKNIGQVWRLQGRTQEAADYLERLIKERFHTAAMRHQWQAHMELASAYATLGERDRADAEFQKMLAVLEEQRNTAILDSFRTGRFAHALSAYDPYERYIRFLAEANPPRVEEALEVAEQARARSFLEALASVRGAVAAKVPAPLLAEEARIRRAISSTQERLRDGRATKAERDALLAELDRAEQDRERFMTALRVEHPSLAEARYPTLLGTRALQAALRPDEIAVTFFLAEPSSFRWVLSREHVVLDRIAGRSAIENEVERLREQLRAPSNASAFTAASGRLGALLFDRISTADDRPLVIAPHGVLHYVPFEAVTMQGRLVIERHAVSYAPSLNALVQLRQLPSNPAPFRVLAVGNPVIAPAAPGLRAAQSRGGAPARDVENLALLGPLPFAERELHAIGRTFPDRTRIMSGASARESGLRDPSMPQFSVLHFATHGLVSDVQPKRSGLLLAPEAGEDGLLQMSEIYGLGLKANLVVLSACQTALGREITGEGLIGLSRAFFYAGARSVVATLWNLNDRFAADFVERFYREVNEGHSSEEALRRAKVAYLNDPRYSHPFYWSSLVLLGDGTRPLVPERVPRPLTSTVLAGGLLLVAAGVTGAKLRKSV